MLLTLEMMHYRVWKIKQIEYAELTKEEADGREGQVLYHPVTRNTAEMRTHAQKLERYVYMPEWRYNIYYLTRDKKYEGVERCRKEVWNLKGSWQNYNKKSHRQLWNFLGLGNIWKLCAISQGMRSFWRTEAAMHCTAGWTVRSRTRGFNSHCLLL